MNNKAKLLYFVTEDWYFWSHRRLLALAALNKGYDVSLITRVNKHADRIRQLGINLIPIELDRHGKNIFRELVLLMEIAKIYKRVKPDLVHHVAMKPILYGTIAAVLSKTGHIVNAYPGLGYIFHSRKYGDRVISYFLKKVFMLLFRITQVKIVVQNSDDANLLINEGVCKKSSITIIKGSGVDLMEYMPINGDMTEPVVLFASRLLWQKGVADFVKAAGLVKKNDSTVRFVIVGEPDRNNPNSVPEDTLHEWHNNGQIEWWGFRSDMPAIIAQSRIVVLPTYYGEGIPKILIEAAASGKPIIATDTPGCRDIVRHGVNGFLVPINAPEALAEYIGRLLDDYELRLDMGRKGRKLVESEFTLDKVNSETLQIYENLLEVA